MSKGPLTQRNSETLLCHYGCSRLGRTQWKPSQAELGRYSCAGAGKVMLSQNSETQDRGGFLAVPILRSDAPNLGAAPGAFVVEITLLSVVPDRRHCGWNGQTDCEVMLWRR
jgi:hypothetical protein